MRLQRADLAVNLLQFLLQLATLPIVVSEGYASCGGRGFLVAWNWEGIFASGVLVACRCWYLWLQVNLSWHVVVSVLTGHLLHSFELSLVQLMEQLLLLLHEPQLGLVVVL